MGVTILTVSAQSAASAARYLAGHPVSFPVLWDRDRVVIRMYGVYHRIGLDAFNMARPAYFMVDRGGQVRWHYVSAHQADFPDLKVLREAAAKLLFTG